MFLDKEARQVLLMGVNKVADFVGATMGPGGRIVNIKVANTNHLTKDGATVAKLFTTPDPAEQVGVDLIYGAAKATLDEAGDGTTTTTVMARAMMFEGHQRLSLKKLNTNRIGKEMVKFSEIAIKHLEEQAVQATLGDLVGDKLLLQVGTISANGDSKMASMCLDAIRTVGPEPASINLIEAEHDETDTVEYTKGLKLPARVGGEMLGPYSRREIKALNDTGSVAVIIAPSLDSGFSLTKDFSNFLKVLASKGHGVLLVCKEPLDNIKTMFTNDAERFQMAYISPNLHGNKYTQLCEDLIVLTGAQKIKESEDIEGQVPFFIGYTTSVLITKDGMNLIGPAREGSEEQDQLVEKVREMLRTETNDHAREMLKDRIARLTSGVASIRVASSSDSAAIERKDRYDDCIRAICTAAKSGVVRGGGAAYLSAAYRLAEEDVDPLDQERKLARELVETALTTPFNTITMNALNYNPKINGRQLVTETTKTIDVWSGDFIDAFEEGILDPLGVQTAAVRNAVKVTAVFLNTGGMYQSLNKFL